MGQMREEGAVRSDEKASVLELHGPFDDIFWVRRILNGIDNLILAAVVVRRIVGAPMIASLASTGPVGVIRVISARGFRWVRVGDARLARSRLTAVQVGRITRAPVVAPRAVALAVELVRVLTAGLRHLGQLPRSAAVEINVVAPGVALVAIALAALPMCVATALLQRFFFLVARFETADQQQLGQRERQALSPATCLCLNSLKLLQYWDSLSTSGFCRSRSPRSSPIHQNSLESALNEGQTWHLIGRDIDAADY